MENENTNRRQQDSVYSQRVRAGKRRTYFFDVRRTKGDDYYLTLTESTRRFNDGGYERHKIFLYKEDFNRFMAGLEDAVNHVKTELIPDYDYDEFTRRHEEFEARKEAEANGEFPEAPAPPAIEAEVEPEVDMETAIEADADTTSTTADLDIDDDMSW